jgi:hypothetical protein
VPAITKTFESSEQVERISKERRKEDFMKPTIETFRSDERADAPGLRSNRFPITDCNYHAVALGGYNGRCAKVAPSFLNISRDYFKTEARHQFVEEAVYFAMMIVTTGVALGTSAYAIIQLCRAFGAL